MGGVSCKAVESAIFRHACARFPGKLQSVFFREKCFRVRFVALVHTVVLMVTGWDVGHQNEVELRQGGQPFQF